MKLHRSITAAAAALVALAAPAAAQAACERPGVTVTAGQNIVEAGAQQNYSYQLCFNSQPDRYDVQVFKITVTADGDIGSQTPVTSVTGSSIRGAMSPVNGSGTYTASQSGDYLVRVRYYAADKSAAESIGEATWTVTPPRIRTVTPPTPVQPDPPVQPTPVAPTPKPQGTPTPTPVPEPQGAPQRAALALTKRAAKRTVRPGRNARFTLTVRNTSKITALNVTVCDRLPSGTQYVTASKRVSFKGAQACVKVGTLKAGKNSRFTLTLKIDRTRRAGKVINRATATATNADTVKAAASVKVPKVAAPRVKAPVTG